jgi:chromosome condensin MukBEF complex kleisin-like MukF subunit
MSTIASVDQLQAPRLFLSIDVTELTDEKRREFADRVTDLLSEYRRIPEELEEKAVLGWTSATLNRALAILEAGSGKVQAAVIRKALLQGGVITREEVFQIAGFPEERTLNGFTTTTNEVVSKMMVAGEVPANATRLLVRATPGRALRFTVPNELAELL